MKKPTANQDFADLRTRFAADGIVPHREVS